MNQYYLIGSPISHSLSPTMMNFSFQMLGMDAAYDLCDTTVETAAETVERFRREGVSGWNVTMPCKSVMQTLCDELSPAARIGGAVNTVKNENGRLIGYTTDGIGFMNAVSGKGVELHGKKMTLFGSGGAAAAILIQAALDGVSDIAVYCNRPESARHTEELCAKLEGVSGTSVKIRSYQDHSVMRKDLSESAVLVNATNVGMAGGSRESASLIPDISYLSTDLFVYDIIYHPFCTPLLQLAKEAGCSCDNGLSMLIGQGAESFRIWTGQNMPVSAVTEKLEAALS